MQKLKSDEIKKILASLLKEIKKTCEEHNIKYFLSSGTMLGAVLYQGFIPWDDDIDVFMPRQDYEMLKKIWNKKADTEKYSCVFPSKGVHTRNLFMTVNDNNTTFIKPHQKDLDINLGIAIDILPLDGCPTSRIKRKIQKFWALIYSLYCAEMPPQNHGKFKNIAGRIMLGLVRAEKARYMIYSFAEKKMTKYKIKDCDYITELCSGPKYMQLEYPKELFAKAIYKEFEGYNMPIPIGYDKYLKMAFGNYMELPPKDKQCPAHDVIMYDINNSYKKYM